MAVLDPATILLALAALAGAIGLSIVAGMLSARVFFDASREAEEDASERVTP
jgi:hypothetical protein